jgi:hypothetical protein
LGGELKPTPGAAPNQAINRLLSSPFSGWYLPQDRHRSHNQTNNGSHDRQTPIPETGGQDYRGSNQKIREITMRVVTVCRVDYAVKTKLPIGVVLERRETERLHNYQDMLRLARRLFALDTADAVNIVIQVSQVRRIFPELTRDCAAG